MLNKSTIALVSCVFLSACAASQPRIIQASSSNPDITITLGLATQIEMPDEERITSVVVGNKDLVMAESGGDIVSLSGKSGSGETNLIVRSRDKDGDVKVYQYRITVQKP